MPTQEQIDAWLETLTITPPNTWHIQEQNLEGAGVVPPPLPIPQETIMSLEIETPMLVDGVVSTNTPAEDKRSFATTPMSSFVRYNRLGSNNGKDIQHYERQFLPDFGKFTKSDALIGIEVEVENIKNGVPIQAYWTTHEDGSLRNCGREFVSVPLKVTQLTNALSHLNTVLYDSNDPDFSPRTSVHIHLNIRDLSPDQLWCLVILYAIFERHFYNFVGDHRCNSIFCVPIFRTNYLKNLNKLIYNQKPLWSKYIGLNLLPVVPNDICKCYGTVEFRHMYGTLDQEILSIWIDMILHLFEFSKKFSKDVLLDRVKDMNTTSSYMDLYNQVFGGHARHIKDRKHIESCISNVKRELFGDSFSVPYARNSLFDKKFASLRNTTLAGEF